MKIFSVLVVFILGLCVLFGGFYTNPFVPAGHVGYIKENPRIWGQGGFVGLVSGPGNFGFSVWRNESTNVDVRPQTFEETFSILAKDDLMVTFRFQTVIAADPKQVKAIVDAYPQSWYEGYIKKPFRSFVRDAVKSYESRDIKAHRDDLSKLVHSKLGEYMKGTPFIAIKTVIGNIQYPETVIKAVELKLKTQQDLERKEVEREIAIQDAAIRVEEAKGIAKAQEIINTTLTNQYLQHEAIQAQLKMAESPNHTTVYIPSGANGIPLVREAK